MEEGERAGCCVTRYIKLSPPITSRRTKHSSLSLPGDQWRPRVNAADGCCTRPTVVQFVPSSVWLLVSVWRVRAGCVNESDGCYSRFPKTAPLMHALVAMCFLSSVQTPRLNQVRVYVCNCFLAHTWNTSTHSAGTPRRRKKAPKQSSLCNRLDVPTAYLH